MNDGLSFGNEEGASLCCSVVRFDNVIPIKGHRTPEQIQAQLEARYAEMAAVYNSPAMQFPCSTCRWVDRDGWLCNQPLVKGFSSEDLPCVDWRIEMHMGDELSSNWPTVWLCGIEKALWEPVPPRLNWLQRFWAWFIAPWKDAA